MTTMNVADFSGTLTVVEKPLAPGQAAMAASRPVVLASDQSPISVTIVTVPSHAVTNIGTFATQVDGAALTSLQLIDDVIVADDAAFTPATTKVAMAGFTFDDSSPDSVNEGDAGAARMSANRNVYTTIRDAAGSERGLNVDSSGAIAITVASLPGQAVTNAGTFLVQENGSWIQTDDAAFTPATSKVAMIGAEFDNVGTDSVDEGDGGALRMSGNRNLLVNIRDNAGNERGLNIDAAGQLAIVATSGTITTVGTVTTVSTVAAVTALGTITPGTAATSLGKAEDAGHTTGDVGVMALAVRNDTATALATTTLDYIPMTTNARGATWIAIEDGAGGQVTSFSGGTQYTEDVASAADPVGPMTMSVRRDTLTTTIVSADGDNIVVPATNKGKLWVAAELRLGDTVSDTGSGTGGSATQRVIMDSSQLSSLLTATATMSAGFQLVGIPSDQTWPKGLANRIFSAAFPTLTRPGNTTTYTASDAISNATTASSVSALSATLSDVNDDPIFISEILLHSTDTGLAGKRVRAYLYNSDPTTASGVSGGDNATFSNKKAGYIGSFSGRLETGFSDGTPGRLVPSFQLSSDTTDTAGAPANGFVVTPPASGAKSLYIQFQAIDSFIPSASSTTIIATARGWQGRAA